MQILKPAFSLSLQFQLTNSSIADTLPNILKLISTYKTMNVPEPALDLCKYIATQLSHKFDYELNRTQIYSAAAVLKLSVLKYWLGRSWSSGYLAKGLSNLANVAELFLFRERKNGDNENNDVNQTPSTAASDSQKFFSKTFQKESEELNKNALN